MYKKYTKSVMTLSWEASKKGRFRNSQQAFAQGVKITWPLMPSLQLGIWQSAVSNLVSAFSNWKKILSKNIPPFGTVKTESENIWICWWWRWLYKKQQNKEIQIHWGINVPVFNKYTGALICLCLTLQHWGINFPVSNNNTETFNLPVSYKYIGALICLCSKIHWGINVPVSYKIHWDINLHVSNK